MLSKAGADVHSRRDNGATPLFIAAASGHEEVLVSLLEAGAQMTATNDGHTPQAQVATSSWHMSIVTALSRWAAGIRD